MTASGFTLPATAGALHVRDVVFTHTSVKGDMAPNLHPMLREFLAELPVQQRERFAGWCAEAVLVSDQLYTADQVKGSAISISEARAALRGSRIRVVRVREPGDPTHGQRQPPCRSCAAILTWLAVDEVAGD